METRFYLQTVEPEAYKAMTALEKYISTSSIDPLHKQLIKIRASQINGCTYCIDMHTKDARKLGETEQRIYLLSAWRETDLYSEEERVILAMTEEITLIGQDGLTENTYQKALEFFNRNKIAQIIMAIVTINAWNRIGVSTGLKPVVERAVEA